MMSHAKGLAEESLFHPLLKCLLCRVVSMTTGQSKETLCHIVAGFIMPDLWKVARLQGNFDTPEVVCMCLFVKLNLRPSEFVKFNKIEKRNHLSCL